MKVDLTDLPIPQQIDAVERYLLERMQRAQGKRDSVFASDLMQRFKNRKLTTNQQRVDFYSAIIVAVLKRARRAAANEVADKIISEAPKA